MSVTCIKLEPFAKMEGTSPSEKIFNFKLMVLRSGSEHFYKIRRIRVRNTLFWIHNTAFPRVFPWIAIATISPFSLHQTSIHRSLFPPINKQCRDTIMSCLCSHKKCPWLKSLLGRRSSKRNGTLMDC